MYFLYCDCSLGILEHSFIPTRVDNYTYHWCSGGTSMLSAVSNSSTPLIKHTASTEANLWLMTMANPWCWDLPDHFQGSRCETFVSEILIRIERTRRPEFEYQNPNVFYMSKIWKYIKCQELPRFTALSGKNEQCYHYSLRRRFRSFILYQNQCNSIFTLIAPLKEHSNYKNRTANEGPV